MVPRWAYLGATEPLWLMLDPDGVRAVFESENEHAEIRYQDRLSEHRLAFAPSEHYLPLAELDAALATADRVLAPRLERLENADQEEFLRLSVDNTQRLRHEFERARRVKADEHLRPLLKA